MKRSVDAAVLVIGSQARSLINFRGPLLQAVHDRGFRVIAAAPHLSDEQESVAGLAKLGVNWREFPLSRTGLNAFADLRSVAALVRLMRAEKPEVVLGYTAKPVIYRHDCSGDCWGAAPLRASHRPGLCFTPVGEPGAQW